MNLYSEEDRNNLIKIINDAITEGADKHYSWANVVYSYPAHIVDQPEAWSGLMHLVEQYYPEYKLNVSERRQPGTANIRIEWSKKIPEVVETR